MATRYSPTTPKIYFDRGFPDCPNCEFSSCHKGNLIATVIDFENRNKRRVFWCPIQLVEYERAVALGDKERSREILTATTTVQMKAVLRRPTRVTSAGRTRVYTTDAYGASPAKAFRAKFESTPGYLLATVGSDLIYARRGDFDLGIGFRQARAAANIERWGRNLLGRILEDVRTALAQRNHPDKDVYYFLGYDNIELYHDPYLDTTWNQQTDTYAFERDVQAG